MAATCTLPPHLSNWGLLGTCAGQDNRWDVVALESASTEVQIRGFVAQVSAKLVYCNDTKNPLQVKTVFPVDESAAVYHCEARLDGRTIVTHCMEKSKAEKVYKKAVSEGKTAVMAREHGDTSDILTLNLGNFPAESQAEVSLRLVMELKVQTDGAISFVLPTVLNPRYSPAEHSSSEDPFTSWLYMRHRMDDRMVYVPRPYSIDVKAEVSGSHRIARVISHTDALNVTLADDALSAQVGQDGGFKCDHDWSMLVYYNNAYQPHLLRETGDRSATGIMKDDLLMLNFFPEVPADSYSSKNEIIFVIDRSGSMGNDKIQSARTALLLFLKSLPPGCLFNVVSFGSTFSLLFPEGSRVYTEETLGEACFLQANMKADMGGTEILRPLQDIYSRAPTPGYSRQILLITDGEVCNVDSVLQLVGRHAHETRLFSVGVGHGASTALVRGAARAGRGRSEMVVQQGLLQQKVMGLVSSMVQDNIQDVSVACDLEPVANVKMVPKVPPVIFGGQHLILYARVPSSAEVKSVTVRGELGTNTILNVMESQHFSVIHDEAKSIHRLAARAQIQQWQLDEEEDVAEDMVALSMASGVVCRRTALVGVDEESGETISDYSPTIQSTLRAFSRHNPLITHRSTPSPLLSALDNCNLQIIPLCGMPPVHNSLASPVSGVMSGGTYQRGVELRRRKCSILRTSRSIAQTESFRGPSPESRAAYACTEGQGKLNPSVAFDSSEAVAAAAAPPPPPPPQLRLLDHCATVSPPQACSAPPQKSFPGLCEGVNMSLFKKKRMRTNMMASGDLGSGLLFFDTSDSPPGSSSGSSFASPSGSSSASPSGSPSASPSGLLEVVNLQQFDGSWKLKDAAQLISVSLDALCDTNPIKREAAWATALVLVLLERKFGDQRDQWALLATKAHTFIAGCGEQVEELLAKARLALDSRHRTEATFLASKPKPLESQEAEAKVN